MKIRSKNNRPLPIGQQVAAFSREKPAPNTTVEIVDNRGQVVNIATVQTAGLSPYKSGYEPYVVTLIITA